MEKVSIWYASDSKKSAAMVGAIKKLGLEVHEISALDFSSANIIEHDINIFIIDLYDISVKKTIAAIEKDRRIQGNLKFVFIKKSDLPEIKDSSYNLLHLEFIHRTISKPEFVLLLEKSVLVERYREILKSISQDAESRIEIYEGMLDINRKNSIFNSEREKQAFEHIISFEKNLLREQMKLSKAISNFALLRHSEMFDLKKRIHVEEILTDLRRREMLDAKKVIEAQESLIDYSAKELDSAKKIINASENVAELSRIESINLHGELEKEKSLNRALAEEIDRLINEVKTLNERLDGRPKK